MEASVVFRPLPCFSGAAIDAHYHHYSSKPSFSGASVDVGARFPGELRLLSPRDSRASLRPSRLAVFYDDGHLQYYSGSTSTIRCGVGNKEKEKEKGKDTATKKMKKRLKLLKGLSRDLSTFSEMGFGLDPDLALVDQVKGKMISEAAELMLGQLQLLRAEEKELKRKKKEEKAKLKVARMQNRLDCEVSSSSSSESSDGECGEVVDMSRLKSGALTQAVPNELETETESTLAQRGNTTELQPVIQEAISVLPSTLTQAWNMTEERGLCSLQNLEQECCTGVSTSCSNLGSVGCNDISSLVTGPSEKKIQVCMGGKCKKSGAAALLEEFQRVVGVEGAVGGCKCMGKCRDGPNVRVLNCFDSVQAEGVDDSVRTSTNPLCIGVGLEDVGLIVTNFFGETQKDLGLAVAS